MSVEALTTHHLDYLQRTAQEPPPFTTAISETAAPARLRRLLEARGIGLLDKQDRPVPEDRFRLVTEDLLAGLSSYRLPLAFNLVGTPGAVSVRVGTWLPQGESGEAVQANLEILRTLLGSLVPSIDLAEAAPQPEPWPASGLVLGIPSAKLPDAEDGALPLDRLIRALAGTSWSVLVLAQPVGETFTRDLRLRVINEIRAAQTASKTAGVPSPLADHYAELLNAAMVGLTLAQSGGAWRTAVYLLGEAHSYYRLASAWRGIFSGERSLPEPLRVWDRREAADLASRWAMPDPGPEPVAAPGHYRHPFQHQTLLTSAQLAAYVHLPHLETGGFAVTIIPDFDAVPPTRPKAAIQLGTVVERDRQTPRPYTVPTAALVRHTFVTGVTGSGKTNSVFHLLKRANALGVPFLVVEPAKAEYRALLDDPDLGARLQVFTLGNENISPFRLNPFEFPDGVPVGVHIDLLRSAFHASFGMWTPLPQVLETCLYRIYEDRGWDITANSNRRLDAGADRAAAFPTLTDLVLAAEETAGQLGYEERVTADIRAALRTRLNALRTGGKGRMLDVQRSLPMQLLLDHPTILELEGMGDDDDKAFVMGLVMIRLAEQRRVQGERDGQLHLLVIEEAHRLLGQPSGRRDETEADVRGKAVETFTNLLAEIRAYGQGVIVVDQVPSTLAPEVLKNTNLKLAHRIVAGDDRAALAAAMVMNERQTRALATLPLGRGAVFAEGEDAPLLIQVPPAGRRGDQLPSADRVRDHMQQSEALAGLGSLFLPSFDCNDSCRAHPDACLAARKIAADPGFTRTFARTVLSAIHAPGSIERSWPDLRSTIDALRIPWIDPAHLLPPLWIHAARRYAGRLGARAGWSYTETAQLAQTLYQMLMADPQSRATVEASFQATAHRLMGKELGPFLACQRLWADLEVACLCRHPVADLVADGTLAAAWRAADAADARSTDAQSSQHTPTQTWEVCQDAADQLIEFPEQDIPDDLRQPVGDAARRVALCFGQQMLANDPSLHQRTKRRVVGRLFREAGYTEASDE
jgi:hypothetical protein